MKASCKKHSKISIDYCNHPSDLFRATLLHNLPKDIRSKRVYHQLTEDQSYLSIFVTGEVSVVP